ncbi:hypothetical protein FKM82_021879 [Ascaphus truei]
MDLLAIPARIVLMNIYLVQTAFLLVNVSMEYVTMEILVMEAVSVKQDIQGQSVIKNHCLVKP